MKTSLRADIGDLWSMYILDALKMAGSEFRFVMPLQLGTFEPEWELRSDAPDSEVQRHATATVMNFINHHRTQETMQYQGFTMESIRIQLSCGNLFRHGLFYKEFRAMMIS